MPARTADTFLTKEKVVKHSGHNILITPDANVECVDCSQVLWSHRAVLSYTNEKTKARYNNMKVTDPDRYRTINRVKSQKRRAKLKALKLSQEGDN